MADHTITDCEVGKQAAAYGDLDANSLPAMGGVMFDALSVTRADFMAGFSEPGFEHDAVRSKIGRRLHQPETITNRSGSTVYGAANDTKIRRLASDGIDLELPFAGIGPSEATNTYTNWADYPLTWILESSLAAIVPGTASGSYGSDTAKTAGTHATGSFEVTTVADYSVGMGVARDIAGIREYAVITGITGNAITVTPKFSAAPSDGDVIIKCRTLYPVVGVTPTPVHLRFNMSGKRRLAVGGRMSALNISLSGGTWMARPKVYPGVVLDDDANAAVTTAAVVDGDNAVWDGTVHVVSAAASGAAPGSLARNVISTLSAEVSISFPISRLGAGVKSIMGCGGLHIGEPTAEINITAEPDTILDDWRRLGETRNVVIAGGATGVGQGFAFIMMGGQLADHAGISRGGEGSQVQTAKIIEAPWGLDDASTAPANTPWRILLPEAGA